MRDEVVKKALAAIRSVREGVGGRGLTLGQLRELEGSTSSHHGAGTARRDQRLRRRRTTSECPSRPLNLDCAGSSVTVERSGNVPPVFSDGRVGRAFYQGRW